MGLKEKLRLPDLSSAMFYLCCFGSHADGGSEEPPDRRQASVDARQSRSGQGTSTENDCAFEADYAIPPLPVTEGMQQFRIMEGMSRSLPSSPLLTHQSISVRLQPVKKLPAPLRKAKFVESPRIPESELGSPTLSSAQKLDVDAYCPGDAEQELGPPPSVDEAANTLMTRLGFLLGEKVTEVQPGPQYSMEVQDENQSSAVTQRISPCSTLTSSTASPPASSPCSTLPPVSTNVPAKDCSYGAVTSPTSTLESRDSGIIGEQGCVPSCSPPPSFVLSSVCTPLAMGGRCEPRSPYITGKLMWRWWESPWLRLVKWKSFGAKFWGVFKW
ncbi:protein TANC1-like isoform X1 [Meleagris gallopavo]|uniref:protein TANC1-like isoform X1 n=1 Tax=Meleagris gallopavo TaxID=9103 RepID=UPI0009399DC5|nr:protein TANC1-like isoform X1 [Meleagris gallopavo]